MGLGGGGGMRGCVSGKVQLGVWVVGDGIVEWGLEKAGLGVTGSKD